MCVPQEIKAPRRKIVRGNTYRRGLIINFNLINTWEERKREKERQNYVGASYDSRFVTLRKRRAVNI